MFPASASRRHCHAQYTANVQGLVQDPSAAGIANAKVDSDQRRDASLGNHDVRRLGQLPLSEPRAGHLHDHRRGAGLQARRNDHCPPNESNAERPHHPRGRQAIRRGDGLSNCAARQYGGDTQSADARQRLACGIAAPGPQLHLAGDPRTRRVRSRHHGRRDSREGPGHPDSGVDNYSTETAVDVSANGQGTGRHKFIVDGLT